MSDPKIVRKTAKIFAGGAPAGPTGISQFGSLAASSILYSLDPAIIQQLAAWASGWNGAVVGGNSPAMEDMNAALYVMGYQTAYQLQQGIPEYDSGTTYYTNGFCSYLGVIYRSLVDTNIGNVPASSPSDWVAVTSSMGAPTGILQIVSNNKTSTVTNSTTGYVDYQSVAFTPLSPTSTIIVIANINLEADQTSGATWKSRLVRGATPTQLVEKQNSTGGGANSVSPQVFFYSEASPGTSATTYATQFAEVSGTFTAMKAVAGDMIIVEVGSPV